MVSSIVTQCELDSIFFTFSDEIKVADPLKDDLILATNVGTILEGRHEEGGSNPCSTVIQRPLPFGHYFAIDLSTGVIDTADYNFIRGALLRIPDDITGAMYTAEVNINVTNVITVQDLQVGDVQGGIGQLESVLPYRGFVFSSVQPPSQDRSILDLWWDSSVDPPVLYFLDRKSNPFFPVLHVLDPNPPISSTQEELEASSDATQRTDGYGGVIRLYPQHNIQTLSLERDTDTVFGSPYVNSWQDAGEGEEILLGLPPSQHRVTIDGEPCSQLEADSPELYVRFIYEQKDPDDCFCTLGFYPCFGRTKFICGP